MLAPNSEQLEERHSSVDISSNTSTHLRMREKGYQTTGHWNQHPHDQGLLLDQTGSATVGSSVDYFDTSIAIANRKVPMPPKLNPLPPKNVSTGKNKRYRYKTP